MHRRYVCETWSTRNISDFAHLPPAQEFTPFSLRLPSRSRDVVRVQSGRCDVCSAAGSAEQKGGGRPSAGGHQGFAHTGCLARPVTREVRCQATSRQIMIIQGFYESFYKCSCLKFFFYRGRPRPDLCRLKYYFIFKIHQFPPSGTLEAF